MNCVVEGCMGRDDTNGYRGRYLIHRDTNGREYNVDYICRNCANFLFGSKSRSKGRPSQLQLNAEKTVIKGLIREGRYWKQIS